MPTVAIMRQVVDDLAVAFPELNKNQQLYLSPTIIEVQGRQPLEIQVCDGGVEYRDFEGGIRSEHFTLLIGLLTNLRYDTEGQYWMQLQHLTESIFVSKERVIDVLEGSFLTMHLLTNPLRIVREAKIRRSLKEENVLIKELYFLGGYIWPR